MSKTLRSIGLMSGTSLDGIDVALVETDGEGVITRGPSMTFAYEADQQASLRLALADALLVTERTQRPGTLADVENKLTAWHTGAVESFLQKLNITSSNIDVIGFHGQTILHRPEHRLTVQLGNGAALAKTTGIQVIHDMRAADVAAGGQGAPLVPIYHAALALTRPSAFVNIGGVGNVTFIGSNGDLLAFDTGPGNALINDWMLNHLGLAFDDGGKTALAGKADMRWVESVLEMPYYSQKPPKSLDRNSIRGSFLTATVEDGAATYAALTAHSIAASAKWFPEPPKQWIICGGGRHNAAIMKGLSALLPNVVSAEAIGLNGDSMEAEAWAYLAVRSLKGLPITFPGTTGVAVPLTGGMLAQPS